MSAWLIVPCLAGFAYLWAARQFFLLAVKQDPPAVLLAACSLAWLPIVAWFWLRYGVRKLRGVS